MAQNLDRGSRDRVLAALKQAESFLQGVRPDVSDEARSLVDVLVLEGQRLRQANNALLLAIISDQYAPAKLFAPWASVRRIREWRDDPKVKLDVIVRNGKCCVRPSSFFAHWATLPDESKNFSAEQSAKGMPVSLNGGTHGINPRRARAGRG